VATTPGTTPAGFGSPDKAPQSDVGEIERAASFTEFGMFGRQGALSLFDPIVRPLTESVDGSDPIAPPAAREDAGDQPDRIIADAISAPPHRTADAAQGAALLLDRLQRSIDAGAGPSVLAASPIARRVEPNGAKAEIERGSAVPSVKTERGTIASFNLLLSGDGAVEVVVRSGVDNAQQRAALRQAIISIVAEAGFSLEALILDGAREHFASLTTGGSDGDRAN
jgi:hypothetical protein